MPLCTARGVLRSVLHASPSLQYQDWEPDEAVQHAARTALGVVDEPAQALEVGGGVQS